MAVCDPNRNAPPPAGVRLLTTAELTPDMQKWAASYAYDMNVPYWNPATGDGIYRRWFGDLPIVALVLCHSYTDRGGERTYGAYHGVTLFRATDASMEPPRGGATVGASTSWRTVAVSAGAIGLVVAGFVAVLRVAGAERARAV